MLYTKITKMAYRTTVHSRYLSLTADNNINRKVLILCNADHTYRRHRL